MNYTPNPIAILSCACGMLVYLLQLAINSVRLYTDTHDKTDKFKTISAIIIVSPLLLFILLSDIYLLSFLADVAFFGLSEEFDKDYRALDVDHHKGDVL